LVIDCLKGQANARCRSQDWIPGPAFDDLDTFGVQSRPHTVAGQPSRGIGIPGVTRPGQIGHTTSHAHAVADLDHRRDACDDLESAASDVRELVGSGDVQDEPIVGYRD
jgi:hypothetical protein